MALFKRNLDSKDPLDANSIKELACILTNSTDPDVIRKKQREIYDFIETPAPSSYSIEYTTTTNIPTTIQIEGRNYPDITMVLFKTTFIRHANFKMIQLITLLDFIYKNKDSDYKKSICLTLENCFCAKGSIRNPIPVNYFKILVRADKLLYTLCSESRKTYFSFKLNNSDLYEVKQS